MLCPFCLKDIPSKEKACKHCEEPLPPMYVQHYSRWRPPVMMSAVGFSGHGKTVYLASLFHLLQTGLCKVWPKFRRQALNQETVNVLYHNLRLLNTGTLPESTRRSFPKPSIHLLSGMPRLGERIMLIYDPPGEAFNEDVGVEKYAGFVQRARCVMFLISLSDMDDPVANEMHRLLETYTLGMSRMKSRKRQQHLIVVYTKADLLMGRFEDGAGLLDYLRKSELNTVTDVRKYRRLMRDMSEALADFTASNLGALGFLHLAHDYFKSVAFCAVSALGSAPEGSKLLVSVEPRRVVDPLFWVFEKSR
jgi:hypothetical protein